MADDYLASTATTGVVNIGGSTPGSIEVAGDQDWFQVSLVAGQTYQFRMNSASVGGLGDSFLTLYNASGSELISNDDGGDGLNSLITYTASESAVYFLGARAYSSGIGNYTVSVALVTDDFPATIATTGVVNIGESATGSIEVSGDQDWFQVSLVAGQTYQFRLNSGSVSGLSDPYLTLYNASGSALASNNDGSGSLNSLIMYTASESGIYFLGARANSSGVGNYTVSAALAVPDDYAATTATTGVVNIGGSTTGSIENTGDQDWFKATLVAGQTYEFRLNSAGLSGLGDPQLSLFDGSGSLLTSNNDGDVGLNSRIVYTPSKSGTYYLGAGDHLASTGDYIVSADLISDDYPATIATTGVVNIGESATGSIEFSGDQDWFQVSLVAGQKYEFRLNSASEGGLGDPQLSLYNSSGGLLTSNNDGDDLLNSRIVYIPLTSGIYYLGANGNSASTGDYIVSADLVPDDYLASTSTAGVVNIGGSTTGSIEINGDQDWFKATLVAGQTYDFRLNSASVGGLGDPQLSLYDSSGSLLTSNNDGDDLLNSHIVYTPSKSGTYYLGAGDHLTSTGDYIVSADLVHVPDDYPATIATTGVVNIGDSATGSIEVSGDQDWFQVSLIAGQAYQFHLNSGSVSGLSDPYLTLYNASGSILASNNDGSDSLNSLITYAALESGTYYLGARANSSGTGNYTVSAALMLDDFPATTATTGVVNIGGSTPGSIELSGDQDWFQVSLMAGQIYQFRMNSASVSGLGDSFLTLYNASGSALASNDDGGGSLNSLITYTALESGAYYLGARAYSSGTGNYTVSAALVPDDFPATIVTTGVVNIGESATGTIEINGDQDWFQVTLMAGQKYEFRLNSASEGGLGDPQLLLYNSGGGLLTSNNDGDDHFNSRIVYTPSTSGTYYLGANGNSASTGNYIVSADLVPDDYLASTSTTGVVTIGGSTTGTIEINGDQDWFEVALVAGQTYGFRLNSAGLSGLGDPQLSLYDSFGSLLTSNNDGDDGLNSLIAYTPSKSGTYYLGAGDHLTNTGDYTVAAALLASDDYPASIATSGVVTIGGSTTGTIESSSDQDWFQVSLAAGQTYEFRLNSSSVSGLGDPQLSLFDGSGSLLTSNNDGDDGLNSRIVYTPSKGGTYYLGAGDHLTNTGDYTVAAALLASDDYPASIATSGVVTIGGSTTGTIESSGDQDWFQVSLTAGQTYDFRLNSAGLSGLGDPQLSLFDGSGSLLTSNNDGDDGLNSRIVYTPSKGGTYYLGAGDHLTSTGDYTVAAALLASDDYPASIATSGVVTVGGSTTGTIESSNDQDWFQVSLAAGQTYEFRLNSAGLSGLGDPQLSLFDGSGSLLTSNNDGDDGLNSRIIYTPSKSGTYYLGAGDHLTNTGDYTIAAALLASDDYPASIATSGVVTVGGSTTGTIESSSDQDWFQVSLVAGQTYEFRLNSAGLSGLGDPQLSLFDGSGSLLTSNNDGDDGLNSHIVYTPSKSGTYYLGTGDHLTSTGDYVVSAALVPVDEEHPPVANEDSYTVTSGLSLVINALTGVLANDSDSDGDSLTASLVTPVSHGTLNLNADGSFSYTPDAGYTGTDTFIYRAFDGASYSPPTLVTISVSSAEPPSITGKLEVPTSLYPAEVGVSRFSYANNSTLPLAGTLLVAQASNGGLLADPLTGEFSDSIFLLGLGDGLGALDSGETGALDFSTKMATTLKLMTVSVSIVDPNQGIDWGSLESKLKPEWLSDTQWHRVFTNFQAEAGTSVGSLIDTLAENGHYLTSLGVRSDSALAALAFELEQAGDFGSLVERSTEGTAGTGWAFLGDLKLDIAANGDAALRGSTDLNTLFTLNARDAAYYTVSVSVGQTINLDGYSLGAVPPLHPVFTKNIDGSYASSGNMEGTLIHTADGFKLEQSNGNTLFFNHSGAFIKATALNGFEATASYDASGRIIGFTGPNGNALTINRDASGNVLSVTDANGQTISLAYSSSGNQLISATSSAGTANFAYDANGDLDRTTAAGGATIAYAYDAAGRLASASVADGLETASFSYDDLGGYTVTDGAGRTAHISLAPDGQAATITDSTGAAASLVYDTQGNLTGMRLPDGSTVAFAFDAQGRPTSFIDATGATLAYSYDDTLNVPVSFTDANGSTRHFAYNDKGQLTQATWVDGTHLNFGFDTNGNVSNFTNRRGDSASYDYDARGQLIGQSAGTSGPVNYTYDASGRMLTATAAEGTTALSYDAAGRVTEIEYPNGRSLTYTYDTGGRRTSMTDQDGKAQLYQYDTAGRLINLSNNTGTLVDYTYDAAGNLIREDNGNGTATTYSYDAAGRLREIINLDAHGSENSHYTYSYDSAGNRIGMETSEGTWAYGYDAVGQLTSAQFTSTRVGLPDKHIEYVYDAAGNRVSQIEDGVTTHYTANALNQYQTAGDANLSYDADGNLISKTDSSGTWHYAYDLENRLVSVTTAAGDVTQYEYDVFGNRSATIENGVRAEFLIDPFGLGDVVDEYAHDGSLIASYAHGLGLASRIAEDGSATYYDIDGVGSVTGMTDSTGSLVNRYDYAPFGTELFKDETIDNPYEFNGALGVSEEANGLNYMRARFYDGNMGRFLSEDPLWITGDQINLYRFAGNSSITYLDPEGSRTITFGGSGNYFLGAGFGLGAGAYYDEESRDYGFYLTGRGGIGIQADLGGGFGYYSSLDGLSGHAISVDVDAGLSVGGSISYTDQGPHPGMSGYGFTVGTGVGIGASVGLSETGVFSIKKILDAIANLFHSLVKEIIETSTPNNNGFSNGDPHLRTFDGHQYDFQSVGEFTLVRGTDPGLEIQVRQQPWGDRDVSVNAAVAMRVGDDVVGIYKDQPNSVNINGEFVVIVDGETIAVGGGSIYREGNAYIVTNAHGDGFLANFRSAFIDVNTFLSNDRSGEISGLLGNHDGDRTNDIALANGTVLAGHVSAIDLYGAFADSWRITPETSLFVYADGQSTDTFTNRDFPAHAITVNDLDPAVRAAAEEIVRGVGLTEGTLEFENAVLDVALTGSVEFALAALEQVQVFGPSVGLNLNAGDNAVLNEGDTFNRLISITDDADADNDGRTYSINWGDGSASETGTIAAGVYSANINRSFADGNASHTVSITVSDGSEDTITQQFAINVNDVAPTIALSGAPSVNEGIGYTLNLGAITDPGTDTVTSYIVNWGDGSSDSYSAAGDVTHTFAADGNYTISTDLIDEDGTHVNAGNLAVLVNDVIPPEKVRIGDAPMFIPSSEPNAWLNDWTNEAIRISHKSNYLNPAEIWSSAALNGTKPDVLSGGDIFRGDIGVSGQSLKTSSIPQEIDGTEALRFDLTKEATSVTIDLYAFNVDQSGKNFEAGRLQLLDSSGLVVDELTFNANATGISKTITLDHASGFSSVVFTAGAYNGDAFVFGGFANASGDYLSNPVNYGHGGIWDGSDYLVSAIEFEFGNVTLVGV
ncbi:pre-peptidase C-terminal domain-containing protein [Nitrosomonas sp.]|uniref:pre-peptidase C-terminal domain-containing protein n=1 Tax=Nitrosomonas sp. TaxID=42353 RepID=UPI0025E90AF7|nr:pre-peptidase C-terminal domain-containing protein [Nitrosomonas sp.]